MREERRPAVEGQGIGAAPSREVLPGEVEPRQRLAQGPAVLGARAAHGDALEKGDDRRRAPSEPPERVAAPVGDRQRAFETAPCEMLHQR